jgi:ketosteroid isomerase-like protein
MKSMITSMVIGVAFAACTPAEQPAEKIAAMSIELPYVADYSSAVSLNVSDQGLQTVLNSYKAWEKGDYHALRVSLADSVDFNAWDGFEYSGKAEGLIERWTASRDSLSDVKIKMHAWTKSHFIDKNTDVITVWYTEIDTYKDGRIDSAYWSDINMIKDGKISWYSQYRQSPKK